MENVIRSNNWFGGCLNVETETETRFIQTENGLLENVTAKPNNAAFYYGSRICVKDVNGVTYYDLNGNLLEAYGQDFALGGSLSRPHPYACKCSSVFKYSTIYGIFKRQKQFNDIR